MQNIVKDGRRVHCTEVTKRHRNGNILQILFSNIALTSALSCMKMVEYCFITAANVVLLHERRSTVDNHLKSKAQLRRHESESANVAKKHNQVTHAEFSIFSRRILTSLVTTHHMPVRRTVQHTTHSQTIRTHTG